MPFLFTSTVDTIEPYRKRPRPRETGMPIPVGTRVTVDDPKYPGVWTVAKVNPKTYKLAPVGTDGPGMGRNLVAPHSFVRQAGPDHEGPATGTVTFAPIREPFY